MAGDGPNAGRWRDLDTAEQKRASTPVTAGAAPPERRPARPQPLLLAAGVATVLPAAASADGAPALVLALGVLGVLGLALWAILRRHGPSATHRRTIGAWLGALSVAGLLLVLFIDGGRTIPETYLLVASALVCSLAPIPWAPVRWGLQLSTVAAIAVALAVAGRGPLDVGVSAVLVLVVAVLVDLLAGELVAARRSEVAARTDAERRTELLEAVRDLPGTTAEEAVAATVRTLRELAFDTARVAVLQDGQLREVGGDDPGQLVVPRGPRLEWRVIEEDRTIIELPEAGSAGTDAAPDARSIVAAPIRVAGRPAGAVVGGRRQAGEPGPAEIEVAEVLAAHLGVVLDTEAQVRRQRELLDRMAELERMRSGLVGEVSSELRDPLTIVRTVGTTLIRHGDDIDPPRRRMLLEQLCVHADDLRRTIEALLDFSRFQADRHDAEPVAIPLADLVAPVLRATGATSEPETAQLRGLLVEADVALVRHALEILLVAGATDVDDVSSVTLRVEQRRADEIRLEVVRADAAVPSTLVRSLVSQLLVGGGAALDDGPVPVVLLRALASRGEAAL